MQRIYVPTINDSTSDYLSLFRIWNDLSFCHGGAVLDFSNCNFLRPNAVAFIGGLINFAGSYGIPVSIDWPTIRRAVFANLCQSGFAKQLGYPASAWDGHSIPYRQDLYQNPNEILDYLADCWLGKGWVHVSARLKDAIVGKVWEIYANSFEHGKSPVGVYSCGQHFKNLNELVLAVVDFGIGIPNNVRGFLQCDPRSGALLSSSCLNWAFSRGNSTATQEVARGLGLDLLSEFVRVNDGCLSVYSNDALAIVNRSGATFTDLPAGFSGTIVQISLKCDERLYRFTDEA